MKTPKTKICTKCGEEKVFSEYYKDKKSKDGYSYKCKLCQKEYNKINKDKIRQRNKKYLRRYRKTNPAKFAQYNREYREKLEDREKCYRMTRFWKIKNSERVKKKNQEDRELLSPVYVKKLICRCTGLSHKDIPDGMVRVYRAILKFKRLRKENSDDKSRNQSIGKESRRRMG